MKLSQLRDFIAVAHAASIHRAARELRIGQPALSKSIRHLERDLGVPLFERRAKGTTLNEAGRAFLQRAQLAVNELNRARIDLTRADEQIGGELTLAASATPAMLFLPAALNAFRRRYASVHVRIVEGLLPVMLPELRNGSLDFAMAPRPVKALGKEFSITSVFSSRLAVLGRRDHPLRNARRLADLQHAQWVLTGVAEGSAELDAPFKALGLPTPKARVRCESPIALVALIANTDLLALMPEPWLESPLAAPALARIPIGEQIKAPDICLVRREGLPLTPVAEAFADLLIRQARSAANAAGLSHR